MLESVWFGLIVYGRPDALAVGCVVEMAGGVAALSVTGGSAGAPAVWSSFEAGRLAVCGAGSAGVLASPPGVGVLLISVGASPPLRSLAQLTPSPLGDAGVSLYLATVSGGDPPAE